jgi:hypothetical protein
VITVTITDEQAVDTVGVEVNVTGTLTTAEVVGYMEMAKIQHLQSKHTQGPTIYQVPDSPFGDNGPWSDV